MRSDKIVISDDILQAIRKIAQIGHQRLIKNLEATEADLTEHMLEESTMIHQKMVAIGGPSKQQRQLYRRVESLVLVIILAIQSANTRLWRDIGCDDSARTATDAIPSSDMQHPASEGEKDE